MDKGAVHTRDMDNRSLIDVLSGTVLAPYVKRPSWLEEADEAELVTFLEEDDARGFFDQAARLIKNSSDVFRLYLYLYAIFETRGQRNPLLDEQVSARLSAASRIGWLEISDPVILEICMCMTRDPVLREELASAERIEWYAEYEPLVRIEQRIETEFEIETHVEDYLNAIESLRERGLTEEHYTRIIKRLEASVRIDRDGVPIARLISERLQERLGFSAILPCVTIRAEGRIDAVEQGRS